MALLLGNALYEFSMKRREILNPEVAVRYKSLCRDNQPITTWLFVDELLKSIRDIAQVKRMSVKQSGIRPLRSDSTSAFSRRNANYFACFF
jgi:hypothetical protein